MLPLGSSGDPLSSFPFLPRPSSFPLLLRQPADLRLGFLSQLGYDHVVAKPIPAVRLLGNQPSHRTRYLSILKWRGFPALFPPDFVSSPSLHYSTTIPPQSSSCTASSPSLASSPSRLDAAPLFPPLPLCFLSSGCFRVETEETLYISIFIERSSLFLVLCFHDLFSLARSLRFAAI